MPRSLPFWAPFSRRLVLKLLPGALLALPASVGAEHDGT
jgi:hypothetical protein